MKIHICGIYGCGKTTLSEFLSKNMHIPIYSLDDFKYKVKYSKIRNTEEIIKKVRDTSSKDRWIIEGTWSNYAEDSFKNADLIILMQIPKYKCCYRILKRFLFRKKGKNDTLKEALKLCIGVFKYYGKNRPVSLKAHKDLIFKYNKKVVVLRNNKEIEELKKNFK